MVKLSFNANEHEGMDDFDALPAGKYVAVICESERKLNKAGTGEYLKLTFEIREGKFKGRKLWNQLNLWHTSQEAVKMSEKELKTICDMCGIAVMHETSQLHGYPMVLKVVQKKLDGGDMSNDIKFYQKYDLAPQAPVTPSTKPVSPAPSDETAQPENPPANVQAADEGDPWK